MSDLISRADAISVLDNFTQTDTLGHTPRQIVEALPSAQPERTWHSCGEPPKHHKDVLVRGIEAIGNVTVHKVMQWDVDRWRPTDYAPSIVWQEWSEI